MAQKKGRFALQYQDIGHSRIGIKDDDEAQRWEFDIGEIVGDSQLGGGKADPNVNQISQKGKSIILPKRRVGAGSLEKGMDFAANTLFRIC